ncbi:hypothetical protein BT69DRAFT_1345739 [Atractiella rhizophila]|nr:hypothetical protein BT69DRAFT_1345739 [Atractiella rhizophila]
MLSMLGVFAYFRGVGEVFKAYFMPWFWVNHWLVLITYLQHTDPMLPHYREGEWNFQRGALCTIDRNIHGFFFHGIAETHVAHHTSSKIPHYNAWAATEALKKRLGPYYQKSEENYWVSLWKSYNACKFVEDEGDVVFMKDRYGKASLRAVLETPLSDSGVDVQ